MRVNELMIGDWFSFNNTFHRVSALKESMSWDLIGFRTSSQLHWITDDAVQPIRLTHYMLLANGWKEAVDGWNTAVDGKYVSYYIGEAHNPELAIAYISEHDGFYVANMKVKFVHEFQHVLRLLGFIRMANNFLLQ